MGDAAGSAPTAEDETELLRHPVVTLAHGSRNCYCDFEYAIETDGRRVEDVYLEAGFARQVEVWQVYDDDSIPDIRIFWGELATQKLQVTEEGESVTVRATIEDYHFGNPILGPVYTLDHVEPFDPLVKHDEVVFNELIKGRVEPNMSSRISYEAYGSYHFFMHPDSARTAEALAYGQGLAEIQSWTLPEAVWTLACYLNPDQTYIRNPSKTDVDGWLADAPPLQNIKIKTGSYLSECLDALLNPYGYGWTLTFSYNADYPGTASWRIFKLNDELTKVILQQRPGDSRGLRLTLTNVADFKIDTSIVSQPNQITVLGDFEEFEITMELYRGWPQSDDAYTAAQLTQSTGEYWATHQAAWRLWVANESGAYCLTRVSGGGDAPIPDAPPDLTSVFGADWIPRNLEPLDCLTFWKDDVGNEQKRRRPPYIEWYDSDDTWKPLPDGWGETVLDNQIGVNFAGDSPPAELIARGADARLRITCTVRSNKRLKSTASRVDSSANLRVNELIVDCKDKFKFRAIISSGPYVSMLIEEPASDDRIDTAEIETFAENLREIQDTAIMRGTITMIGLHHHLRVGQTISEIKGRNISLNRMSPNAAAKKYLQIVSITHDHEKQQTTLRVAPIIEDLL